MPERKVKRPMSYSKFWTYSDCPLQYKFAYVDKIPEAPRPEYSFGRSIHRAIEQFHRRGPGKTTAEEMLRLLDRSWDTEGFLNPEVERKFKRAAREIVRQFHADETKAYRPPLAVEVKFDMEIDGIPFTGRIDAVSKLEDGTLEVLDYKSSEEPITEDDVSKNVQLGIYQMAAEEKFGQKVGRRTIYHLRSRKKVSAPALTDEGKAGLRRAIVTAVRCIEAGEFPPRLSESCPCDYPNYCPYFKDKDEHRGQSQGHLVDDYERTGLSHKDIEDVVVQYAALLEGGKGNSLLASELEAKMLSYCQEHDVLRIWAGEMTVTLVRALEPSGESYVTFAIGKAGKEEGATVVKASQDDYV